MTAQRADIIIINGKEYKLYSLPLNQFLENTEHSLSLLGGSSGLWRGYHATWLVQNNKLFLIDFWGENFLLQKEYELTDIFPNQKRVFAYWFSGKLSIPMGNQIDYFHGGLGGWSYEYYATFIVDNGLIIDADFN